MKCVVSILVFLVSLTSFAEDEFYIIAKGSAWVKEFSANRKSDLIKHSYMCYPLKVERENFDERYAKEAYEDQIRRKFKDCKVGEIEIIEFTSKKEATDHYRELSKEKGRNRLVLARSSIDRYRKKHFKEMGISEKGGPPLVPEQEDKKKEAAKKIPYYKIYE